MRVHPLLLLVLIGCGPGKDEERDDSADVDTDADTDTDTAVDAEDQDRDGADATVDCDDNDYEVYPGALEACDGKDNDCDQAIDEDADLDQDGAFDEAACEDGTDCDDTDPAAYPGAPEVPYDGEDQDCDGEDLVDVDGDGVVGVDAGGLDCDDTNPDVNPVAEEVPKNGLDDDCEGGDGADGDLDGYDDADLGGDDCDDVDASVHPGHVDLYNDGIDADCDGEDGAWGDMADIGVTISGTSGAQEIAGEDVAVCDLDGDGWMDLAITAPFAGSYAGKIGIFYGSGSASWGAGMLIDDADTLIEGASTNQFFAFGLACADIDGDGNMDLVTTRGEIHYARVYETDFGVLLFYGTGGRRSATMTDLDASAELTYALGVTAELTTVYSRDISAGDIDGDGAAEVLMIDSPGDDIDVTQSSVWVLPGARYAVDGDLADEVLVTLTGDSTDSVRVVEVLRDLDGDGVGDLFVGQSAWTGETGDTGDTGDTAASGDTGTEYPGRADWLTSPDTDGMLVSDYARAGYQGTDSIELGFAVALGDYDGDGATDAALSALSDSAGAIAGGGFFVYPDIATRLTNVGMDHTDASAHVYGGLTSGYMGYRLVNAGDIDGDGAEDLLVSELAGGGSYEGQVWLFSGALLAGDSGPDAVALLTWRGEAADTYAGNAIAAGDLDGDGLSDLVMAAYGYAEDGTNPNGRVYVELTGGW